MTQFTDPFIAITLLRAMSQQQAPIRKTLGSELQPPRNQSPIDQLRHYKPTEEQKAQALKDMANTRETVELPRQIEMPNFPIINRSESEWELKRKATDFFWDTLEGILPK